MKVKFELCQHRECVNSSTGLQIEVEHNRASLLLSIGGGDLGETYGSYRKHEGWGTSLRKLEHQSDIVGQRRAERCDHHRR